nr:PD-(D/E)XK nuclease family protein [Lachnospiraceae bacterium]
LESNAFDKAKLKSLYPKEDDEFRWKTFWDVLGGIRLTNDLKINTKRLEDYKKVISEEESHVDPKDEKAYKSFIRRKLCIPYLEVLAKELSLSPEDFISKYAYIRYGSDTNSQSLLMKLDKAALSRILDELDIMRSSEVGQATEDMILGILKMSVARGHSEEGKLFVTGIDRALSAIRDNLYIAGLSASKYPGSPKEHYLLLDEDLLLFGSEAEYMTSDGRIKSKISRLLSLAKIASGLGSSISVSYAGLNTYDLKTDNASSLVFELFRGGSDRFPTSKELEEHISKVGYFEPAISVNRKIGEAYNDEKIIHGSGDSEKEEVSVKIDLEKAYSPSALEKYFSCPRSFLLSQVMGITEPDDDNPFEIIAAKDGGNIAHALMEKLGNSTMSLDDFLKMAEEAFDHFISQHPPLVVRDEERERENFLDMMETAYRSDPHRKVVLEEEDVYCTHDSGVKIHGFPDQVEELDDGTYLIVDFKTKRRIEHVEDDIDTCLQVVIYAYLMEQEGLNVSGGEFRYIRLGETVTCKYDDEMKKMLFEKLSEFKKAVEDVDFPISVYALGREEDEPDPCKYCKFGHICGKELAEGGSDDEL